MTRVTCVRVRARVCVPVYVFVRLPLPLFLWLTRGWTKLLWTCKIPDQSRKHGQKHISVFKENKVGFTSKFSNFSISQADKVDRYSSWLTQNDLAPSYFLLHFVPSRCCDKRAGLSEFDPIMLQKELSRRPVWIKTWPRAEQKPASFLSRRSLNDLKACL